MGAPSIYDYLDYRTYLRDMFAHRKERQRFFSHRYFAKKAEFASPNFLQLVIKGKRNLSSKSVAQVAKGFDLGKRERDYLELLVNMGQASTTADRNYYYQKLTRVRKSTKSRRLEQRQYEYFSNWYYPVVREVATWGEGKMSSKEIASLITPPLSLRKVEKALQVLLELNLLEQDSTGRWIQRDQKLTTGQEVRSLIIANYHKEMLRIAAESIDRHAPAERDITAVSLGVNEDRMGAIKERIAELRRELLDLACDDENPSQVIQVNIQAFPLARKSSK